MKHINKRNEPSALRRWFQNQPVIDGDRINCRYDDMPGDVREVVMQHLLDEQGGLCCYTGISIDEGTSHIEHFKPQYLCNNHEDIDYQNLLAAYPAPNVEKCPFGAHAKDNWYDAELLVNPLRGDCETRFLFDQFGKINPAKQNDLTARETIERLGLDHGSLTEMRLQAINAVLFRRQQPLSVSQLQKISEGYCARRANNWFPAFCFVISQVARILLLKAERKRKQKQAIRKQVRK